MASGRTRSNVPRGHARIQFAYADGSGNARITVPANLARMIGPDTIFRVELTEEGLLYRFVEGGQPVRDVLPNWLLTREER